MGRHVSVRRDASARSGGVAWRRVAIGCLVAAALGLPALAPAEEIDCPGGEVKSFSALAERLEEFDELTVLSVELLVSPTRSCRETWVVEVLNEEDEVAALLFDARTLEERFAGRLGREEEHDDDEILPVRTWLAGRDTNDLIEGLWSDDISQGGGGRDVFVVTPGSDMILDFTPGEDLLDVGDFARLEDGFGVLRSMADIARLSERAVVEGRPGLRIDIDGPAGDWSVTLLGIRPGQLGPESIHFGIEGDAAPDVPFTHWPDRKVEMSDGTVVFFPAYPIDDEPPEGRLLEGDDEIREMMREHLFDLHEAFGGDD